MRVPTNAFVTIFPTKSKPEFSLDLASKFVVFFCNSHYLIVDKLCFNLRVQLFYFVYFYFFPLNVCRPTDAINEGKPQKKNRFVVTIIVSLHLQLPEPNLWSNYMAILSGLGFNLIVRPINFSPSVKQYNTKPNPIICSFIFGVTEKYDV